jgi:anti-anti-sigma regulatory factor/HAMP domain-containing protein
MSQESATFLRDLSIRARVLLVLAIVVFVAAGTSTLVGDGLSRSALRDQALDQLTSVRELKGRQIEDYFRLIQDQLVTLSEDPSVVSALRDFTLAIRNAEGELAGSGWNRAASEERLRLYYQDEFLPRLGQNVAQVPPLSDFWPEDGAARALQALYISSNPFAVGSKHLLDAADHPITYNRVHGQYHPVLRSYLERFGYYDIFLVDGQSGRIVYSVFKEVDFGTSLRSGPYRDTNLAAAFLQATQSSAPAFTRLEDFRPYAPSYSARAAFIASPVFDNDEPLGVLVFQLPVDRINDIMTMAGAWASTGMGASGETYLVGADQMLRTESRFLMESPDEYLEAIREAGVEERTVRTIESLGSAIGLQPVRTEGTEAALSGATGTSGFRDYRGVPVFSSFRALELRDFDWVIMSEIDEAEALEAVSRLRLRMLVALLLLIPVLGALAFWFANNLTRPVLALSESARELADGHLDIEVDVQQGGEIGQLARSFDTMRVNLKDLLERQNRAIEALSTPLIPIQDDVVVMPLVGEFDQARCDHLRASLTERLHETGARFAILDLTGVPRMDANVADGLIRVVKSVRLLGARAIISGVRPELALQLSTGDVHLEGVTTARTLRDAIDEAVGRDR